MYRFLLVAALLMVAIAMALSLAHALELPGKLRLDREDYLVVQKIYYPGFTIGGIAEPVGIVTLLVLLVVGPHEGPRWWWTVGALAALIATHAVYWGVTHPINKVWTKDIDLGGASVTFFSTFAHEVGGDWGRLRDAWEYSHVARCVLASLSFICLAMAATTA